MTLLKNDGDLLPLAKGRKVLVTGPTANKLSVLNSGWTFTWQGDKEELYPQDKNTILEAIQAKLGAGERDVRRRRGVRQGNRYRQGGRGRGRRGRDHRLHRRAAVLRDARATSTT